MYSRDFGGIKSEGQLYNYEREYNESRNSRDYREEEQTEHNGQETPKPCEPSKGFKLGFLRDLKADDLILIGIGLLLLLDSDGENDIFVLLIAFLLLF